MSRVDVRFIAAPFLPEHQPALGISSLIGVLRESGFTADARYLNIEYGERIGWKRYQELSNELPTELLLGEIVFAPALWGEDAVPWEEFAAAMAAWQRGHLLRRNQTSLEEVLDRARPLYEESSDVVRRWAEEIAGDAPRVVGFTSTFQQNVASLALARELRRLVPAEELTIIFGGANCESHMGRVMANAFEFVDHVVGGEAERVIVDLVNAIIERRAPAPPRFIVGSPVDEMDTLPLPALEDYFAAVQGSAWAGAANIVAESSRGCWWGAKSHCTFCGLNGGTMRFRSKSPSRFAEEIRTLTERYQPLFYMMTDNILDLSYLKTFLPELIGSGLEPSLFYEVKANLRKDQLELMAAGGVNRIQPGIESLSTPILKLMAKGTTRFQNLQLMKWGKEFGIGLVWNFLYGFPGESPSEYDELAALLPALAHLPAPTGAGRIRLDRFAPYWTEPERYGLQNVRPFFTYAFAYPKLTPQERHDIAYFFDFDYGDGRDPDAYAMPLLHAVKEWQKRSVTPRLELIHEGEDASIIDTRFDPSATAMRLTEAQRALLSAFDGARDRGHAFAAARAMTDCYGVDLDALTDAMLKARWLLAEGPMILSLVVDPSQIERVRARKLTLRLEYFGLGAALLEPAAASAAVL